MAFVLRGDRGRFKRIHQEMGARVTGCARGSAGRDAGDKAARPRSGSGTPAQGRRERGLPETGAPHGLTSRLPRFEIPRPFKATAAATNRRR